MTGSLAVTRQVCQDSSAVPTCPRAWQPWEVPQTSGEEPPVQSLTPEPVWLAWAPSSAPFSKAHRGQQPTSDDMDP